MKAKVKATGEIVEVFTSRRGPCIEAGGRRSWRLDELDFNNPEDKDDLSCEPMQMVFDKEHEILELHQMFHIRITQQVIENALKCCSEQQLRDELERRKKVHQSMSVNRCRHCFFARNRAPIGFCRADNKWFCLNKPVCDNARRPEDFEVIHLGDMACEKFELAR